MRREAESRERRNSQEGTTIAEHNTKYKEQPTADERAKNREEKREEEEETHQAQRMKARRAAIAIAKKSQSRERRETEGGMLVFSMEYCT